MDLWVIIVNWNLGARGYIAGCLDSVTEAVLGLETETIVVDNHSADSSVAFIREGYPHVTVIENQENIGFGRGAQTGLEAARGGSSSRCQSRRVAVSRVSAAASRSAPGAPRRGLDGTQVVRVGHKGGKIESGPHKLRTVFEPLRSFPGAYRLLAYLSRNKHGRLLRCEKLDGACMVFRASMLREVGGMPTTTFMYGEEQILGARFRRLGYEVWYDPLSVVYHDLGSSSRQKWTSESNILARQAGHTAAMRETLGPARFVFYNWLLLLSLVLKAFGGLVGHGPAAPPRSAHDQPVPVRFSAAARGACRGRAGAGPAVTFVAAPSAGPPQDGGAGPRPPA